MMRDYTITLSCEPVISVIWSLLGNVFIESGNNSQVNKRLLH